MGDAADDGAGAEAPHDAKAEFAVPASATVEPILLSDANTKTIEVAPLATASASDADTDADAGTEQSVASPPPPVASYSREQWIALALLTPCVMLSMSTYMSASVVLPQLKLLYGLTDSEASLLTIAVQIGFIVGATASALLTLTDRFKPQSLMLIGGLLGCAINSLLLSEPPFGVLVLIRFGTGACIALIYPTAIKLLSSWFKM